MTHIFTNQAKNIPYSHQKKLYCKAYVAIGVARRIHWGEAFWDGGCAGESKLKAVIVEVFLRAFEDFAVMSGFIK